MSEFETASAEMSEVAEPTEETGVEEPEVAEPVSEEAVEPEETADVPAVEHQKNTSDAAMAEMRRQMQQAQQEADDARAQLAELIAQQEARDAAFSRITGNASEYAALSELSGMSEDEVRAEYEAAQEAVQKDMQIQQQNERIQQLETQINEIDAERMMQADLHELQKIDPTLKSLDELGDSYLHYIVAGLSPEDAYWAIKARDGANRATPPKPAGTVATGSAEKGYFTEAEIDAMSSEQLTSNWKKIMASWDRNSKK